ncbi:hydrolase 1, exosortase A system-associated [Thauera sp. WH-2]|uniref:hydrolase 1, exosortase A system-associated n=1 Tax=Thauera sp. WH-2 TaxID=3401574 RepID=UPI003AAB3689
MNVRDEAMLFNCGTAELVGVLSRPEDEAGPIGVLVIVGGPQYRVGSHRQFVLLARSLASQGMPCMRFDYRGMGDSAGDICSFESVNDDVRAAVDAFFRQVPELRGVVLWGLCDGASAACFYAPTDARVRGLILLNPWVRTAQGEAQTYLKHYYLQRLLSRSFWLKLLRGGVRLGQSVAGLSAAVQRARGGASRTQPSAGGTLPERMLFDLQRAAKPALIVLSGRDYVAREFEQVCRDHPGWQQFLAANGVQHLPEADHTFSGARHRDELATLSVNWCQTVRGQI